MKTLEINKTPVNTSRNFNINNIKLKNINIPENISDFDNIKIYKNSSKINIDENIDDYNLTYGLGDILTNQIKEKSNKKLKLTIDSKLNEEIQIDFKFDNTNLALLDNIEIVANENCKSTIIIKYESNENIECFHNGIIKLVAKNNSQVDVIIINYMNENSNNFMSIESNLESNAEVKYTIIEFGGKNSITNIYSNLIGKCSSNIINTIYLGKKDQLFDMNYIAELSGEKTNIDIKVQGALKDKSTKHFKGTINFKKGCILAKGNENEECILLSDTAKSLALPILLCSEENVEGNHSSSAGKIGEKELFYIMSRGFKLKDAMKLMVRAKFNEILLDIRNEEMRNQIIDKIDTRLD